MNSDPVYPYRNSLVRQLAWVIGSPLLLSAESNSIWPSSSWCEEQFERSKQWLAELDADPTGLIAHVENERDRRLGARFESLVEFWLQHTTQFECLNRRLQLINDNHTYGEFDFIVRNTVTDQVEHWEVASKFYLGIEQRFQQYLTWVGPGKKDSLARKLEHLELHQLKLGGTEPAQDFLASRNISIDRVRAFVKGRMFHPYQDVEKPPTETLESPLINRLHDRGRWIDLATLSTMEVDQMGMLDKVDWFDPLIGSSCELVEFDLATIEGHLGRGPCCLDLLHHSKTAERVFVVETGWFDDMINEK